MAGWDGRYWRESNGRFARKGTGSDDYVSIRRTLDNPRRAADSELLDVFMRITMRARRGRRDTAELAQLDAELERRHAAGEPERTAEHRRVDELVDAGESWESAYAEVYGGERGRRNVEAERRKGESAEKARRRLYAEATYLEMLAAEEWTRGNMLSKAGRAEDARLRAKGRGGIEAASLFSGTQARAEKFASEELLRYWSEVAPRRTYAEFRAERLGDAAGAGKARRARAQAGNGKDFG